jgi:hypothetical protein
MRISEDDFNSDLLLNVFAFLTPENTAILGRVSKLWYKLTSNETLWKQYFKILGEDSDLDALEGDTMKAKYADIFSRIHNSVLWNPAKCGANITLDDTFKIATFANHGKAIGIKSAHFTMKVVDCGWMMFGFVTENDLDTIMIHNHKETYDFQFGYLMHNGGGTIVWISWDDSEFQFHNIRIPNRRCSRCLS